MEFDPTRAFHIRFGSLGKKTSRYYYIKQAASLCKIIHVPVPRHLRKTHIDGEINPPGDREVVTKKKTGLQRSAAYKQAMHLGSPHYETPIFFESIKAINNYHYSREEVRILRFEWKLQVLQIQDRYCLLK